MSDIVQQRYITKVRIENFQSHANTEFDLSPGINLIVGSSEGGKSAILRAINFALHNEPRGDDFIRMDETETRVSVWWSDGCYLCRIKGERNSVLIRDKDGFEQTLDRIGTTLPKEALDVLGFPPIDDESGPIAYADQHQPLFLVTLSASELPRTISRLTGIDDFEAAAEILNKQANVANKQIKDSTKRIENYNIQLKKYENLDDQLDHLSAMESMAEKIDEMLSSAESAKSLKNNYEEIMKIGRAAYKSLKKAENIAQFSPKLKEIGITVSQIESAQSLLNDYETINYLEKKAKRQLKIAEKISSPTIYHSVSEINTLLDVIKNAKIVKKQFDDMLNKENAIQNGLKAWTDAEILANNKLDKIVEKMRFSNLWCGECQRPKSMDICNA